MLQLPRLVRQQLSSMESPVGWKEPSRLLTHLLSLEGARRMNLGSWRGPARKTNKEVRGNGDIVRRFLAVDMDVAVRRRTTAEAGVMGAGVGEAEAEAGVGGGGAGAAGDTVEKGVAVTGGARAEAEVVVVGDTVMEGVAKGAVDGVIGTVTVRAAVGVAVAATPEAEVETGAGVAPLAEGKKDDTPIAALDGTEQT